MELPEADRRFRELVASIPSEVRAVMLEVLTAEGDRRAKEIGNLHSLGIAPATVELLTDAEQDPALRAVLTAMLREQP